MNQTFESLWPARVKLLPGLLQQRSDLNRRYMLSLTSENLLRNHYIEAGLWQSVAKPEDIHWGWESPTCQVRGQFLGHWLSAAARAWAATGDQELKGRADWIVSELGRCQRENGGEWVFSIPEKYLDWIARKKGVWAPQYTIHKTLMGLFEMAAYGGNAQALDILLNAAKWFHRWTARFSREQMDDILDYETGGMLEVWANLYGLTGKEEHLDLVRRYDRPRLFDQLLAGEDALLNMHANTTIPEAHGAARAWEVTGDSRWREIVEAYWRFAVPYRGYYCTGGQTCGEIWSPPHELAARLGERTQEHCVVYNMMRLAEYLLRWTGDVSYADYWERNLYNGILAQQNAQTGQVAYFLPTCAGGVKKWGRPTEDFWCCHGTLVQAHTTHGAAAFYRDSHGAVLTQYIPAEARFEINGVQAVLTQTIDAQTELVRRPNSLAVQVQVSCAQPVEFTLKLRLPWWLAGEPVIAVNGERLPGDYRPSAYAEVRRLWHNDTVRLELPRSFPPARCPTARIRWRL